MRSQKKILRRKHNKRVKRIRAHLTTKEKKQLRRDRKIETKYKTDDKPRPGLVELAQKYKHLKHRDKMIKLGLLKE